MTTSTRRERHREHLRREIIGAASAAFGSEGYEQLSMRKLAAQLDCAPGTLYLYFEDKDALLRAVVEESLTGLLNTLRAIPQEGDLLGWVKAKLRAYIEFGLRNPNHYKCAFVLQEARPASRQYSPHPAFGEMLDAVRRCADAGVVETANIDVTSQVLWACIHGLTALLISRPSFPWIDRDALIDELLETALAGVMRPGRGALAGAASGKRPGPTNRSRHAKPRPHPGR